MSGYQPADEQSRQDLAKLKVGTTFEVEFRVREARSSAWNRRYWLLLSIAADHCEKVDLGNGAIMPIHDREDLHVALKLLCGHYDVITTASGNAYRIPKSTNFESMDADEWAAYWLKVLDAIHQHVLPHVEIREVEEEIARLAS